VAGQNGMVGRAICDKLKSESIKHIFRPARTDLDLRSQASVENWISKNNPDVVIIAAAKVGGIYANDKYPAEFLYDNMMIASNVIHASHLADVEKLLFLGSSCIYPKFADQPIEEKSLLTGTLEPTNEWYAVAKIAGIKLCQAYREQYGKDFVSVEDCADALVHILKHYSEDEHINVGSGEDIPIADLAKTIMDVVGFEGALLKDSSKPDGTPQKLMSGKKLKDLGWKPSVTLEKGLTKTYDWFLEHENSLREK